MEEETENARGPLAACKPEDNNTEVLRQVAAALGGEGWEDGGRESVKTAARKWRDQHEGGSKPRKLPVGWRQFCSTTKKKPYYQHKATQRVVWEMPPAAWADGVEPSANHSSEGCQPLANDIRPSAAHCMPSPRETPSTPVTEDSQRGRRSQPSGPAHDDPDTADSGIIRFVQPTVQLANDVAADLSPVFEGEDVGDGENDGPETQDGGPSHENNDQLYSSFIPVRGHSLSLSSIGHVGAAKLAHPADMAIHALRESWQTVKSRPPRFPVQPDDSSGWDYSSPERQPSLQSSGEGVTLSPGSVGPFATLDKFQVEASTDEETPPRRDSNEGMVDYHALIRQLLAVIAQQQDHIQHLHKRELDSRCSEVEGVGSERNVELLVLMQDTHKLLSSSARALAAGSPHLRTGREEEASSDLHAALAVLLNRLQPLQEQLLLWQGVSEVRGRALEDAVATIRALEIEQAAEWRKLEGLVAEARQEAWRNEQLAKESKVALDVLDLQLR